MTFESKVNVKYKLRCKGNSSYVLWGVQRMHSLVCAFVIHMQQNQIFSQQGLNKIYNIL